MARRLSYANVVATLALFVAVGTGGAYAAKTVFSSDIADGEVKSVDIANNSIDSGDVLDNTINTFDVHSFLARTWSTTRSRAPTSTSPPSPDHGRGGREGTHVFAGANESVQADATCQPGEVATRGGSPR